MNERLGENRPNSVRPYERSQCRWKSLHKT
jgi:hypothetical protein